ncbi:recombinase family protein [Kitasatospora atroaurantiaca]|uniref:DNA invertase Pin-like site-specific DNA recombinase n=2 Tax=Kitasatospora atroaurantiaca TaxID=285545 RepID=A0A561EKQ0_9ACTN|nr:DNA invertase Pin-like site-specific DNA recombinase [Kitasatospora atroaurantiaca]
MTTGTDTRSVPRWVVRPEESARPLAPVMCCRFAFYGRVSTEDNQDPGASRLWQLARATALVAPVGGVVSAEYFDIGQSRALPWKRRPRAAALLGAVADPGRGFDAVVIGEPQRAFYGSQFGATFPLFVHYGVPLWVPEVGGPVDPENEAHDLVMSVFGGMSKGERSRIRVRVRSAMAAQTREEGRFLGGRPPYGYVLADLGPHPNPAKAADGKRLHGLVPDPRAALVVQLIFRLFLDGLGYFAIAEVLTRMGIPCPSAGDPGRNPRRSGAGWAKSAVRAILLNPRYTGRQVWNRQRRDEVLLDVDEVGLGCTTVVRRNPPQRWVISEHPVHEAIIDDETFAQVQDIINSHAHLAGPNGIRSCPHLYVLRGRIRCALCGHMMQGNWVRGTPYYRCRTAGEYALPSSAGHPPNLYLREQYITVPLDAWLKGVTAPSRIEAVIGVLTNPGVDPRHVAAARRTIADCDARLATHRAALEAGADPAVVTRWIAQTQAVRAGAEAELHPSAGANSDRHLSHDQAADLLRAARRDITAALPSTDPAKRADLYERLDLTLLYNPEQHNARVEINLNQYTPRSAPLLPVLAADLSLDRSGPVPASLRQGTVALPLAAWAEGAADTPTAFTDMNPTADQEKAQVKAPISNGHAINRETISRSHRLEPPRRRKRETAGQGWSGEECAGAIRA